MIFFNVSLRVHKLQKNIEFNKPVASNSLMIHANFTLEAKYNFSAFMALAIQTFLCILMNYIFGTGVF